LIEHFQALNNLKSHGHAGVDESSKVWRLNAGIKTNKINAWKAQIMSSRSPQDDFHDAVRLHQDFVVQMRPANDNDELNVSGLGEGDGEAGA
jgi:hypothetical protein